MGWITKKVFIGSEEDFEELILDVYRPIVDYIDKNENIDSFHFLRYKTSDSVFSRFRILVSDVRGDQLEEELSGRLESEIVIGIEDEDWDGNIEEWGETGAEILHKHLEYLSRTALRLWEARANNELVSWSGDDYAVEMTGGQETADFHERHEHFFANQIGYSLLEECRFCAVNALKKTPLPIDKAKNTIKSFIDEYNS